MFVNNDSAILKLLIFHSFGCNKLIILNLHIINGMFREQISFRNSKDVRAIATYYFFNLIKFIWEVSRTSIPVTKFESFISPVSVGAPSVPIIYFTLYIMFVKIEVFIQTCSSTKVFFCQYGEVKNQAQKYKM